MNHSNTQSLPTSVTSKGQVTIPAEIREHLGIKPKDKVRFIADEDGTVRLAPVKTSSISELFGSVKPLKKPEDFRTLRREFEEGVAADNAKDL